MPEKVSYWICPCGKANFRSDRRCASCARRRPLSRGLALIGVLLLLLAIGLVVPADEQSGGSSRPHEQKDFSLALADFSSRISQAPNAVARNELTAMRDRELLKIVGEDGYISDWKGRVTGISHMNEGAGLSISIERATLLAGVYLMLELDTRVKPGSHVYSRLLSLSSGENVLFTGRFIIVDESLVEMSYIENNRNTAPRYLFVFDDVTRIEDEKAEG